MKHDLSGKLAFVAIFGFSACSCKGTIVRPPAEQVSKSPTGEKVLKLPSGHTFRSLGVMQMNFRDGPTLILSYVSNAKDVQDQVTIRKEMEEIWPEFRKQVEKAGMHMAILSANSVPPTSVGISHGWKSNVVYSQDSGGQWAQVEKR